MELEIWKWLARIVIFSGFLKIIHLIFKNIRRIVNWLILKFGFLKSKLNTILSDNVSEVKSKYNNMSNYQRRIIKIIRNYQIARIDDLYKHLIGQQVIIRNINYLISAGFLKKTLTKKIKLGKNTSIIFKM